ncbi:MAG: cytochrome c [Microbacterium pygmaeum]|uniref:Cytochrome bc1 complex cytochrome c subunit n=1 Tax=Microbacterium pygmaeum TaxID=370764 RepID=A0A1G8BBY3_9MICO|nr:cytochrome c [Microbacterium pygmaeum]SDH30688.1 menaquinol-cytochrome c reductase cytochrome c1 subunit precursor [Microbacterium pygmaeum]
MARETKRRSSGRRSPWAAAALIGIGLLITGGVYAGASAAMAAGSDDTVASALTVEDGKKLFQANCATCHGLDLQGSDTGPSLYGVGELSVEFQVATGRMPLQAQAPQAPQKPVQFTEDQIKAMASYVQSMAPGPTYPDEEILDGEGDVARGAELFRINCAMCHNVAAAGGALTEGKYAPSLGGTSALHMYAAMVTGPQNMPVFNNLTLTAEDKRDIISSLLYLQQNESPGGFSLGSLGPVSEGLFIWIFGIGSLIGLTVWITAKSN